MLSARAARRQGALPHNLPPRTIGRDAAAAYLSLSETTLDKLVAEGRLAPPLRVGGRVLFDVRKLDDFVDRMSAPAAADDDNPFDRAPPL